MWTRLETKRLVGALALVLGLLAGIAPAGAGEQPEDDHTTAPAGIIASEAPTPEEADGKAAEHDHGGEGAPECTFRLGSAKSEFASCLQVTASLSKAPRRGETVTLTVNVASQIDLEDADVVVDVPEGFTVTEGPGQSRPEEQSLRGTGSVRQRTTTTDLDRGGATKLTYRLRADAAGEAPIEVRASGQVSAIRTEGASDTVNVTIGNASNPGRMSIESTTEGGVVSAASAPASAPGDGPDHVDAPLPEQKPVNDDQAGSGTASAAAATSCISGTWGYQHPTTFYTGVPNYQIEVWDDDVNGGDDLLVEGVTSGNGDYNLCYNAIDGEGSAAQEVYVRYISANSVWRVRNTAAANDNYVNATGTVSVPDGADHDFGNLQPANDVHRGIHAFHALNKVWAWGLGGPLCFDHHDNTCRQMVLNWTNTSTDGTYYSTGGNDIHLAAADPDSEHLVIHEATHAIMDDVYEDDYPPIPNCSPHTIQGDSSQGCAWTEGFAEYVPAAVLNDPRFVWASGASLDLENRDWNTFGWDDGDDTEGRVAGAMIDIDDSAVASLDWWDFHAESDRVQYDTFQDWASLGTGTVPDTYSQYWTDRSQDGHDVLDDGAEGANYNNTIDYSFRDYLYVNSPRTRPNNPEDDHRYRQTNSNASGGNAWTVTVIRPDSGSDFDLRYYEDWAQTSNLATSAYSGSVMDFVAVDHNHRTETWDYPRVDLWSGGGQYDIEWATSTASLNNGTASFYMSSSNVAMVRDTSQQAGVTYYYRIVPARNQNADMALVDSAPGTASTHVRPRSAAVRLGSVSGAGNAEAFSYTSGATDQLGFILMNASGSGTITIYRDTSAPTGSVTINDGDADTASTSVDLDITAADAQTGIQDMRISVDGTFDTEPWVPFSATAAATLPAGDGAKTVSVQLRNNANMVRTVSDTIELYTGTRCNGLMPTHVGTPAGDTIVGTGGADVIIGLGGADVLDGRGGHDTICGNGGSDLLRGRGGADVLIGNGASDTLVGHGGNDDLRGNAGGDTLRGNAGADDLTGHGGNDVLRGNGGSDDLSGNAGRDDLFGNGGPDTLNGGTGSPDECRGGSGNDTSTGGCEVTFSIP